MGKTLAGFSTLFIASCFLLLNTVNCASDIGKLECKDGSWVPDVKLIGFGLKCPLPLDGKASSKGKTANCAFKNLKLYDEKTGTTKRDKIAPTLCAIFPQASIEKECKQKIAECLKNGKDYFKNPKNDKEYKSWSEPFQCVKDWVGKACKKK